ncbi:unnamed protein product [Echinostoma caproni]|uniref:Tektin n=1 Tax=Echinostoma caproni TaxID=27848 RepID=A0A183BBS6_9TREM|nr:unnamed protein product [Echinostoma caproni]
MPTADGIDCNIENATLEADIENTKLCTQTWFIQRQNELKSTAGPSQPSNQRPGINELALYDGPQKESQGRDKERVDSDVPSNLVLQRDWAISRAKRAEAQLSRLRSACLTMRVQIEAGLRYKSEADLVKRELELIRVSLLV